MKTTMIIAGLILASIISVPASATSKGEALTLCKLEAQNAFEDVTGIRTSKIKSRSNTTHVKLRVSRENAETQTVNCTVENDIASLTNIQGDVIASDNAVAASDSE